VLRCVLGIVAILGVCGCSKEAPHDPNATGSAKESIPSDPDQALYNQVRSGAYQIGTAVDSIEDVRKTAREIASREKGDTHKALLEVAEHIDDAGQSLADFSEDPPAFDEFKKNFAAQDEKRLKAIDGANEALGDLHDAQDVVGDLLDSHPPEPENTQLTNADSALDDCIQSVESAIKTMGGKVTTAKDSKET